MKEHQPYKLTLAICTHNRAKVLWECAKKTIDVCSAFDWITILIVNNASTDETQLAISNLIEYGSKKSVCIKSVIEPKLGLSAARNRAIEESDTELIAYIDDDAYVSETWASAVLQAFARGNALVASSGPVVPVYEVPKPDWLSDHLLWAYSVGDRGNRDSYYVYPDHPFGVNMTFRKLKLDQYRFDENLGRKGVDLLSWEESKLFRALMSGGGRVAYLAMAKVYHQIPAERLTEEWMKRRHEAEGLSRATIAIQEHNYIKCIALMVLTFIKYFVIAFLALVAPTIQLRVLMRMKADYLMSLVKVLFSRSASKRSC